MATINTRIIWMIAVITVFVVGCATPAERVVLLPGADGRTGALVVKSPKGEARLDKPYETADIRRNGQMETKTLARDQVEGHFGPVLAALPLRPVSFTLYFLTGKDELTAESKPILEVIKSELLKRPTPEITIIGHADKVGQDELNDLLSLKRAEAVLQAFRKAGITGEKK